MTLLEAITVRAIGSRSDAMCGQGEPNSLYRPSIAIQVCLLLLTTSFVGVRSYVRLRLLRVWNTEDVLCVLQLLLFAAYTGLLSHSIDLGNGCSDLPKNQQIVLLYWDNVLQIFYNIVLVTTKVALLLIYMNIFAPTRYSRNWWAIVSVLLANVVFFTVSTFFKIFMCHPRSRIWDKNVPGFCVADVSTLLGASAIWNTISDLMIVALPALFISRLQFSLKQKLKIILGFMLAAMFYPIFSIVGLVYRQLHVGSSDTAYWQPRILLFVESEIAMGIICSCLPALQRLIRVLIGADSTVIALERQKNYNQNRTYVNIDRRRRRCTGADFFDISFIEGRLASNDGRSQVRADAGSPLRPVYFRTKSQAQDMPLPDEPMGAGILMTTDIEVAYEPAVRAELSATNRLSGTSSGRG